MKRISPATVIASVALFFSLGGASLAASHYLITSTHQIAPKVRRELRGARGVPGPAGQRGPAGSSGAVQESALSVPSTASVQQEIGAVKDLTSTSPTATVQVSCPTGQTAVAGGFNGVGEIVTESNAATMTQTNGSESVYAWVVTAHLDPTYVPPTGSKGTGSAFIQAYVLCSN